MIKHYASTLLFLFLSSAMAMELEKTTNNDAVTTTEKKEDSNAFSNASNFIACGSDITKEILLYPLLDDFKNNIWRQIEQESTEHSHTPQTNQSNATPAPTKLINFQNLRLTCKLFRDTINTFTQDPVIINRLLNALTQKFNTIKDIYTIWNTASIMCKILALSRDVVSIEEKCYDWLVELTGDDNPCNDGHAKIIKLLIHHGADVNKPSMFTYAPLHWASLRGKMQIAEVLIKHGADINKPDSVGNTPLHIASHNGYTEIAEQLINNGGDINKSNVVDETPLWIASCYKKLETIQLLIDKGARINQSDYYGDTPLHKASLYGHAETVKLLINSGAEINKPNKCGQKPLTTASARGYSEIIKLLTENGAQY